MKVARWICNFILCAAIAIFSTREAVAGELSLRLSQFPQWESKPNLSVAVGDLFYPEWFVGTWEMHSTLVDMVAPLAPDFITPGFEGNRSYLNVPIISKVRFFRASVSPQSSNYLALPKIEEQIERKKVEVVADRGFNGFNLAIAYLGKDGVLDVKSDRENPNRQVTILPNNRQLISVITRRGSEAANPEEFTATEICQQIFQSKSQVYLNEVETTSAYHYRASQKNSIVGEQVTAIYLSPQDPNYFKVKDKPVALYRYHLDFKSVGDAST